MSTLTPNPNPTCPECGCDINWAMSGVHDADCPIGLAEDATRLHDVETAGALPQRWMTRPPRTHEVRLQLALGFPADSVHKVHVLIEPPQMCGPCTIPGMPGQRVRIIPPGPIERYNHYRKDNQ